jgi:hypothetical protein
MTVSSLLIENIATFLNSDQIMKGGKMNNSVSTTQGNKSSNVFVIMVLTFIYIMIKGVIVYILYNMLVPKLIYSLSKDRSVEDVQNNFKPITYIESVLVVILFNTLFSM